MFYSTVIPQRCIDCAETSDVSGDSAGWDISSSKFRGEWFQTICFDHEKKYFHTYKKFIKYMKWQTSES